MNASIASAPEAPPTPGLKFLTFMVRDESYGVPIQCVREIIPLAPVTPVPRLPHHIEGVINLRGKIVPVINLGRRFGFAPGPQNERVCIIVVQIAGEPAATGQCGLIVDAVEEVVSIALSDIEEMPSFGSRIEAGFIAGLVNLSGKVKTLLQIEKILRSDTTADSPALNTL